MASTGIIKFTTTTTNENILQNTAMKSKIKELKGNISEDDYQRLFNATTVSGEIQGIKIKFSIMFSTDNKVFLNSQSIANDTFESIFDSQGYIQLYAIKVQTPTTATIMFSIN